MRLVASSQYNEGDVVFDGVEYVEFSPEEWEDNPWICKRPKQYLIGSGWSLISTPADEVIENDFNIYLISVNNVRGPIKLSDFLGSLVVEYDYDKVQMKREEKKTEEPPTKKRKVVMNKKQQPNNRGNKNFLNFKFDFLDQVNWDEYFSKEAPESIASKYQQAGIWNSGKGPYIMKIYNQRIKNSTIQEISKELTGKNGKCKCSYMTLMRFIQNILLDIHKKQ